MSVSDFLRHNSLNRLLLIQEIPSEFPYIPINPIITNLETGHYCRLQIIP